MSEPNPASSSSGARPKAREAISTRDSTATKSPTGKRTTSYARAAASKNIDTFRQNREYQVSPGPGPGEESQAKRQKTRRAGNAEDEIKATTKPPSEAFLETVRKKADEEPVPAWKPSIVMGSALSLPGEDLSRIELADRKIAQRRALLDHYGDITNISELLREAIEERNKLDDNDEENTKPLSSLSSTHKKAVDARVTHLREVLETSDFLPERQNILAAISGYESGQIPCSDVYTLIWSGRIVDTSPDYSSFTRDRTERLDRYHEQYGDGWLWYEPPLKEKKPPTGPVIQPTAQTPALKALCLNAESRLPLHADIGLYKIDMGFQKRRENVARISMPPNWNPADQVVYNPFQPRRSSRVLQRHLPPTTDIRQKATTMPDPDAPRVYLECLLDSGASVPFIYDKDLALMGINAKAYAAQTSTTLMTTAGQIPATMYELDVGVYKKDLDPANPQLRQHSTIVSSDQPIWPTEVDILGGTMPVSVHRLRDPALATDLATVDDAWDSPWRDPPRLSGMLPFMVCYMSSVPGRNLLWLGEDRVDVVGSDRLPGQLRYRAFLNDNRELRKSMESGHEDWMWPGGHIGALSKVTFEHAVTDGSNGTLREEDYGEGKSFILVGSEGVNLSNIPVVGPAGNVAVPQGAGGGADAQVRRFVINPSDKPEQIAAMAKRTERAERERKRQERRQQAMNQPTVP